MRLNVDIYKSNLSDLSTISLVELLFFINVLTDIHRVRCQDIKLSIDRLPETKERYN